MEQAEHTGAEAQTRRRAVAACDYCRRKKLKCDSKKPCCGNCRLRGRPCVQVVPVRKPRPTNMRIQQLEEENHRLRELAATVQSTPTVDNDASFPNELLPADNSVRGEQHEAHEAPISQDRTLPGIAISAEAPESTKPRESQYHGPTSALFDEPSRNPQKRLAKTQDTSESKRRVQCQLVAETAKQRHLESINLTSRSLEFDGVDPEIGMNLLSIYWSRQQHCGLIVYRPVFMRDMACGGPYFSKLLLNSMYFSASKHSPHTRIRQEAGDNATAGWEYRQRITELLKEEFDKSKVTTIQALLIAANSLFSRCDESSASWLYAGNAFNMIIDLGLHVTPSRPQSEILSEEDLEVRRRVFWGAYVLDKVQCLYQGRPPILRVSDASVAMMFLDDYEELEPFDYTSFTDTWTHGAIPVRNSSVFKTTCELSIIMERILTNLYAGNYTTRNPENFNKDSMDLQVDLERWRQSLPPYVEFHSRGTGPAPPLPHISSLLAMYNVLVILLRRPLVAESRLREASPTLAYQSLAACLSAANEIVHLLRVYSQTFSVGSAPYIISYATYISATILVRLPGQRAGESSAMESLATCVSVLEQHKKLYAAARRTRIIISHLMERMGATSYETQPVSHSSPRNETDTADLGHGKEDTTLALEAAVIPQSAPDLAGGFTSPTLQGGTEVDISDLDMDLMIEGFMNNPDALSGRWNFHIDNSFGLATAEIPFEDPSVF